MDTPPDVLIVGFGAIGALYAFILGKTGQSRVTVVTRSRHTTLNERGIHIRSGKHGDHNDWKPFRALASIDEALDRPYAYVIVTTKAVPEVQKTTALLAPLLSQGHADKYSQPTYVIMQNGINVEVDMYQSLKTLNCSHKPRIISTTLWAIANMLEGGTLQHYDIDRITIGMYRETMLNCNSAEETAILGGFQELLRRGGCDVTIVSEIQRVKFTKNIWNATFGVASAITRLRTETIFLAPQRNTIPNTDVDFVAQASASLPELPSYTKTASLKSASPSMSLFTIPFLHEALGELRRLGALLFPPSDEDPGLDPDIVMNMLRPTAEMWGSGKMSHRVSMLVDVENGRPTEVEVIVGELVRMARRKSLVMPRVEGLYALMLMIQNQLLLQHR